jgi:NitT/TauT family transport system permease protein
MANDTVTAGRGESETLTGLDALEIAAKQKVTSPAGRFWAATWPKLAAIGLALGIWQVVVWTGWKDPWALPGPIPVFTDLGHYVHTEEFWSGLALTGRRAAIGVGAAVVVGFAVGLGVARVRILRAALGSMITALQTMPSIAWFPLAILLFQLSEQAIFFVVVLGAAPSIANGVIHGVDYVPPLLLRAGRNIGASGLNLYRYVIAPAALPAIIAGLKQGWAFAWRSLMAGELLVTIPEKTSIGVQLIYARDLSEAERLIAIMIVILVLGLLVDLGFGAADRAVRRRWGVLDRAGN